MAFDPNKSVSLRIVQTARAQRTEMARRLIELGLHPGQDLLLKALNAQDGQTMSQLASALGVKPPTVTKMITRLSAQGYVERKSSETDGRQTHVHLSAAGIALLNEIDHVSRALEKTMLNGIEEKERKKLRKTLKQIEKNLSKQSDKTAS